RARHIVSGSTTSAGAVLSPAGVVRRHRDPAEKLWKSDRAAVTPSCDHEGGGGRSRPDLGGRSDHFEKLSPECSGPSPSIRKVMWPGSFQLTRPTRTGPLSWARVSRPWP